MAMNLAATLIGKREGKNQELPASFYVYADHVSAEAAYDDSLARVNQLIAELTPDFNLKKAGELYRLCKGLWSLKGADHKEFVVVVDASIIDSAWNIAKRHNLPEEGFHPWFKEQLASGD